MEKRKPHCSLERVKALVSAGKVRATRVAYLGAADVGIEDLHGMCDVIRSMSMRDFYKSMMTYASQAVWQDVYRTRTQSGQPVYLKLTVIDDILIISFKELDR